MPASARAAYEGPLIIKLADLGELDVQDLSELVRDEDPARAMALRLMLAEMNDIHSLPIKPANVTDCQCCNFPDPHTSQDTE